MHLALEAVREGKAIDESFLQTLDTQARAIRLQYPSQADQARLVVANEIQESPPLDPWEEIDVDLTEEGELLRAFSKGFVDQVDERSLAIGALVRDAIMDNPPAIQHVIKIFRMWMRAGAIVRIIGAGRALLAASVPANRLHHGGAAVSLIGDKSPLPNSHLGGGIIAASASGETRAVIEDMTRAYRINEDRRIKGKEPIVVVGVSVAHQKSETFKSLCTPGYYVGLRKDPPYVKSVELRGLADLEEYAISVLLDALVVRAGMEIGCNFRVGHEDFGATGPWHQHDERH